MPEIDIFDVEEMLVRREADNDRLQRENEELLNTLYYKEDADGGRS